MKYIVKRNWMEVGAEVGGVFTACDLGYCFAKGYPELVKAGWKIYCREHRSDDEGGGETYHTGFGGGINQARDIAEHINTPPPPPPVHDCPKCDCKPEQGCCK